MGPSSIDHWVNLIVKAMDREEDAKEKQVLDDKVRAIRWLAKQARYATVVKVSTGQLGLLRKCAGAVVAETMCAL
eukprot:scaffold1201_cov413-Prasinococcus_capsulatus_cf.AAC.14